MLSALQKLSFAISCSNYGCRTNGHFDKQFSLGVPQQRCFAGCWKQYLSICQHSEEEILKQKIYKGVIMGVYHRLFVSIPTKHPLVGQFYNVHYLLDTGSPITTLTRKALCTLHQKEYKSDSQHLQQFFLDEPYQIGSKKIRIQCSNPDKESESRPYHNVNLLGMDYLRQFQRSILDKNFIDKIFLLKLSNAIPQDWGKKRFDQQI